MLSNIKEGKLLAIIVTLNFILKAIPAFLLELGNDEVYYWTYALYPDISHFDHPPLIGFTIQLFTLNLKLNSEFFIRLGALIFSSINIVILFYLIKKILDRTKAWIGVILYISSIYFNIIGGWMILPDAPQLLFVLLSLYFLYPSILKKNPDRKDCLKIILSGLIIGLAFLSKYHSLFIWFGIGLYILFYNRLWLKRPALYISIILTLLCILPVYFWNQGNDFISFTYHGDRVSLFSKIKWISFMQFNLGQIFYHNPINFILYVLAIIWVLRSKEQKRNHLNISLLLISFPLIIVFTLFSLTRTTLPHWAGPSFIGFVIICSHWLGEKFKEKSKLVRKSLISSTSLIFVILYLGLIQISTGFIPMGDKSDDPTRLGRYDFTMDMYGWGQTRIEFEKFLQSEGYSKTDYSNIKVISNKWFPAAHLDYYVANPLNIDLICIGDLSDIHKYYWINEERGNYDSDDTLFFMTSSQQYKDPAILYPYFHSDLKKILEIKRRGVPVKNIYVFELKQKQKL